MNAILANIIDTTVPKINPKITEGVNDEVFKFAPEYIDNVIQSGMRSIRSEIPLTYEGWRRMTPKEEYEKMYSGKNNRVIYDIAESDLYMVEYRFVYDGQPIVRHVYMPLAREGNIMKISSTPYNIVSIMSDTVMTPSHKHVFVRLSRAKLIFVKTDRTFLVNGVKTPCQFIYSDIYKTNNRNIEDKLGNVVPPINLYILGAKGARRSYEQYAGVTGVVVGTGDMSHMYETHRVYSSTKLMPARLKDSGYIPHDLSIAIPLNQITASNNDFIENFTSGIMYTLDVFPIAADDFMSTYSTDNVKDEKLLWRSLLSMIVFKNSYSRDKMLGDINDHFITLKSYIDVLIQSKLKESGVVVDDFFDLLGIITANYNAWVINSKLYNADLNNRYIDVLYYMMYDMVIAVNKMLFDINRKYGKNGKPLSFLVVQKNINDNMNTKKIYSILSRK